MQNDYSFKISELNPLEPLCLPASGTVEISVDAGSRKRRMLLYIPRGSKPSCEGVFVLGENGKSADDLWKDSGWKELADREKFIVCFLEPDGGIWNTEELYGQADGDIEYIDAAYLKGTQRTYGCIHEAKFYIVGYGEGGVMANMAVMNHPSVWAGLCTAGGSGVPEAYMKAAGTDICTDLGGYEDEGVRAQKAEIPVPVWLIEDPDVPCETGSDVSSYWKKACGITEDGMGEKDDLLFIRTQDTPNPVNQDREAYRLRKSIRPGISSQSAGKLTEEIRSFLFAQRRWMGDPFGDLQMSKDVIRDIGMKYCTEVVDGWLREWYVYVPEKVKREAYRSWPLVFAMHGYSCTGELYACDSGWYKVADKYGFILVHPTGTPGSLNMETQATSSDNIKLPCWNVMHSEENGPDENRFFEHVYRRICEEYSVDRSRVFATGHSYGSVMTQILGITESGMFTAVAPCSGVFFPFPALDIRSLPEVAEKAEEEVAVWMFMGDKEEWLFPNMPKADNVTGETILYWQKRNVMEQRIPDEQEWIHHGKWNDIHFKNADGVPLVNYTWVSHFPHATTPEMSFRIWEEFFSRLGKKDGKVFYLD